MLAGSVACRPRRLLVLKLHQVAIGDAPGIATGEMAEDPGGIATDKANSAGDAIIHQVDVEAFGRQHRPLDLGPVVVVAEPAVVADHSMAREDDRDRVAGQGTPDSPDGLGLADLPGHP